MCSGLVFMRWTAVLKNLELIFHCVSYVLHAAKGVAYGRDQEARETILERDDATHCVTR